MVLPSLVPWRRRGFPRHAVRLICLAVITLKSAGVTAALPPPAEPPPKAELVELARKKFGTLSLAEELFFRAAQDGTAASVVTGDEIEDDPANAGNWLPDRVIRAACLAWVCNDPQASALVTYRGLQFFGMCIDGELDLSNADIKFQLYTWKCSFSDNISLQDAKTRGIYLLESRIKGLNADRAIISGSVLLRGVKAEAAASFRTATISGDLDCEGAEFLTTNARKLALTADGAKIGGRVFLRHGFKARGEVNLLGASIGGELNCTGGLFSNAGGTALNANSLKVEGSIFLRDRFRAEGEVNLITAVIGGSLDCNGGQFSNPEGLALQASGMAVQGVVALRKGFKADGGVRLVRAAIGGDLSCIGGQFSEPRPPAPAGSAPEATPASEPTATAVPALNAESAKIQGNVYLRDGFRAKGTVSLVAATIRNLQILDVDEAEQTTFDLALARVEGFWDDVESRPKAGNLHLDGFRYDRINEVGSRKKWLHLQPGDEFRPQPYEQLAAVLRQMGHDREARKVMIMKNQAQAKFTHIFDEGWLWYKVFGPFIKYGYAPWRAFAASIGMILLGFLLFRRGFRHGLLTPTSDNAYAKGTNGEPLLDEKGQPKISEKYPVFNAFVYSLESFVPLLKLDQSGNWRPNANRRADTTIFHRPVPLSGRFLRGYLYIHIAAGWLLTSLWVGAVTGLVKT